MTRDIREHITIYTTGTCVTIIIGLITVSIKSPFIKINENKYLRQQEEKNDKRKTRVKIYASPPSPTLID